MGRIKIEIEDVVGIAGNDYRLEREVPGGYFLRSVDLPSAVEFFDHAEIELTMAEGMFYVRPCVNLSSAKQMETALQRRTMCEALQHAIATGRTTLTDRSLREVTPMLVKAADRAARRGSPAASGVRGGSLIMAIPSPTTLRRLLRRYDGTLISVFPNLPHERCGNPLQGFSQRVADAFRRAAERYIAVPSISLSKAYRDFRFDLLSETQESGHAGRERKIPCACTFHRVLQEIASVEGHRDACLPHGQSPSA